MEDTISSTGKIPIQSTAGAVAIKNKKGEFVMQKVKVNRYVTGKRPDYAADVSSDSEDEADFMKAQAEGAAGTKSLIEHRDSRLKRLQRVSRDVDEDEDRRERIRRHRDIREPELLEDDSGDEPRGREGYGGREELEESSGSEQEEQLDEEEVETRRALLRQRALDRTRLDEELLEVEDERKSDDERSSSSSSEYEEYTDSDDEEDGPRLKPVFRSKTERQTIKEREQQVQKHKEIEIEVKIRAEDRKKQSVKLVEDICKQENQEAGTDTNAIDAVNTDDENFEEEYEAWKIRELSRIKRDREERENTEREKQEVDKMRQMTEEERRAELRNNPKQMINKAPKGKYKFLQKYYHRGVFFLDKEADIYKRDYSSPTLEDHFDKTILPKVMQVKNFGRSGRTKYTHLVDQDTTQFDSAWSQENPLNNKFTTSTAGGLKQVFDRPTTKKRKLQR